MKRLLLMIFMLFGLFSWALAAGGEKINLTMQWYPKDKTMADEVQRIHRLSKEGKHQEVVAIYKKMILDWEQELQRKGINAKRIKEIKTNIGNCYYLIGCEYYTERKDEQALEYFQEVASNYVQETGLGDAARTYIRFCNYKLKKYEESILHLRKVIQNYPQSNFLADARYGIACSYYKLGNYEKALPGLEQFLEDYPGYFSDFGDTISSCSYLAWCYFRKGDYAKAVQLFESLAVDYPKSKWMINILYGLGHSYKRQKDYAKAIQTYRKLLAKEEYSDKDHGGIIQFRMADCYLAAKDFPEAEEEFERYVAQYPQGKHVESAHRGLCLSYLNQGKMKEGFNELAKSGKLWLLIGITVGIFGGGILLAALFIFVIRRYHREKGISISYPGIKWKLIDMIIIWSLFFIISLIITTVSGRLFLGMAIADIIMASLVGYVVMFKYRLKVSSLGFKKTRFKMTASYCLIGTIIVIAFNFIYEFCLNRFFHIQYSQAVSQLILSIKTKQALFFPVLFITIIGPFCEEVFFRGFLYNGIKKYLGITPSIILSALLFALIHLEWMVMIPIAFTGAAYAYLYEKSGSLWASIVSHVLTNSGAVALLLVKGL